MRLLQISKYYYPYIGGTEQVVNNIVTSLIGRDDIEQKIICFNENVHDKDCVYYRKETVHEIIDGIEIIRCGCIAKKASQSISLSYHKELKKLLIDFEPDIVIFHYPNPFVASIMLPMLNENTKLILYWHLDITRQKILGRFFHRQNLNLCKRANLIIATSPNYIKGSPYLSKFYNKCCVVPNCISQDRLAVTDKARTRSQYIRNKYKDKTIVFAVGRHVEYKGMGYLIRAAKMLDDNFIVLIAGEGPLTKKLLNECNGDGKIKMLGRISDENLIACLIACDIFAFPSITKNEAFGIALAEGMYFEKPAVTFKIEGSGVNYVNIDKVTGLECENSNEVDFAKALKILRNNENLRKKYGEAAKQRILENFTYDIFENNIIELLTEVY